MEQDYGMFLCNDEDDDYVQDYSNYYGEENLDDTDYSLLGGNNSEVYSNENNYSNVEKTSIKMRKRADSAIDGNSEVCGDENDYSNRENNSRKSRKRDKNSEPALNNSKKKRFSHMSGAETFYSKILAWDTYNLRKDNRKSLGLFIMLPHVDKFHNVSHYYGAVQDVAFEESRAALLQGLRRPEGSISVRYHTDSEITECAGDLLLIVFEFGYIGQYEWTRPGVVYNVCLSDRGNRDISILGAVAQNSVACSIAFSDKPKLPMWVNTRQWRKLSSAFGCHDVHQSIPLMAQYIGNLISYQRMVNVAVNAPVVPFLPKLLGEKPATHIKFYCSDDDEDVNVSEAVVQKVCDNGADQFINGIMERVHLSLAASSLLRSFNQSQRLALKHCIDDIVFLMEDATECGSAGDTDADAGGGEGTKATTSTLPAGVKEGACKLVQGPPGCGKTHFLVGLLCMLVSCGCRVLVCAPSNKAVAVVISKFLAVNNDSDDNAGAFCVLVGVEDKIVQNDSEAHAVHQHHHSVNANHQTVSPSALLPSDITSLTGNILQPSRPEDVLVYGKAKSWGTALMRMAAFAADALEAEPENVFTRTGNDFLKSMYHLSAVSNALFKEVRLLMQQIKHCIPVSYKKSDFGKLVYVFNEYSAQWTKSLQLHISHLQGPGATGEKYAMSTVLSTDEEEIGEGTMLLLSGHISRKLSEMSQLLMANSMSSYIADELTSNASVVFCTLASSGSSMVKKCCGDASYPIDVVLVDEAGQSLESELTIPFMCYPKNMVLVGDPNQLPATVLSQEAVKAGWQKSCMERLMGSSAASGHRIEQAQYPYDLLNVQYRMHPDISMFPNRVIYNGCIMDDSSVCIGGINRQLSRKEDGVVDQLDASAASSSSCGHILGRYIRPPVNVVINAGSQPNSRIHTPLAWCNAYSFINIVGEENGRSSIDKSTSSSKKKVSVKSFSNRTEAFMVTRLCVFLHQILCVPLSSIAIVTFYAGQVVCIQQSLAEQARKSTRVKYGGIRVATVDSFQGSESDVVILSFVRSNKAHNVGFVKDFQRLNVAVTRAKFLLLALGDADTLQHSISINGEGSPSVVQELIKDANARNRLFDSSVVLADMISCADTLS